MLLPNCDWNADVANLIVGSQFHVSPMPVFVRIFFFLSSSQRSHGNVKIHLDQVQEGMQTVNHTVTLDRRDSKSKMKSNEIRRREEEGRKEKGKKGGEERRIETPTDFGAMRQ